MQKRCYYLPTLSALTLVTTACTTADPLVGDWVGVRSSTFYNLADGSTDSTVLTLPYTYDGGGVSTAYGFRLTLGDEPSGELLRYYAVYRADGDTHDDRVYDAAPTVLARGQWKLAVASTPPLDFTCTAGEDVATCVGEPIPYTNDLTATLTLDFARASEAQ